MQLSFNTSKEADGSKEHLSNNAHNIQQVYHLDFHKEKLHRRALEIAETYRKSEFELIEVLKKIDAHRVFLDLGYSSLYEYAVKALKLSESSSLNFITVARKSIQVPELLKAIELGDLSVAKARKITPVLNKENAIDWIEKAKTLPKLELEKQVAKVNPQSAVQERAKFVQENRLELKMGISEEIHTKLKRAQNLVSQKQRGVASFEMTLETLLDFYLERNDPLKKAKRFEEKQNGLVGTTPTANTHMDGQISRRQDLSKKENQQARKNGFSNRPYISSALRHQIHLRDQGQCTHHNKDGKRCSNTRWLEVHHIYPVSEGGGNSLENLTTLCQAHHKREHS